MDRACHSNVGKPTVTARAIWRIKRGPKVVGGQYKHFSDCLKATLKKHAIKIPLTNWKHQQRIARAGETFVLLVFSSCQQRRIKPKKTNVVAKGMNLLLGTEKTTPLICVPPVAVHVY